MDQGASKYATQNDPEQSTQEVARVLELLTNVERLRQYQQAVFEVVFKWLNRRSQRKSYTWLTFLTHWFGDWQIPQPAKLKWQAIQLQREMSLASGHGTRV